MVGAWVLKEEKIEHESGEDSLKGTTEPATVTPIVSQFTFHNSLRGALRIENKTGKRLSTSLKVINWKIFLSIESIEFIFWPSQRVWEWITNGFNLRSKRLKRSFHFLLKLRFSFLLPVFRSSTNLTPLLLNKLTRVVNFGMFCFMGLQKEPCTSKHRRF